MKVGKAFAFAQLIEAFLTTRSVEKKSFEEAFHLTEDQFHRYMGNAKAYFRMFHPDWEIVYSKSESLYKLRPNRSR